MNTNVALRKVDADERRNLPYLEAYRIGLQNIASRAHGLSLVSESGLYKLAMRSDKPQAKAFQNRVTKEVLPSIRKMGSDSHREEKAMKIIGPGIKQRM